MKKHKKPWQDHEIEFLKKNCCNLTDKEIGEHLGRTAGAIRAFRYKNEITKFEGRKYKRWTEHEDNMIRRHWPESDIETVMDSIPGRSYHSIKQQAQELNVIRDASFSEEGRFKPQNIYKKTKEGIVTIVNYEGTEYCILNKDGRQIFYHRHLWEKKNGPIPDGHILHCKSSDTANPDPENWEIWKLTELAIQNLNTHGHPSKELSDGWIAGYLASGDKDLKRQFLNDNPEMIRVARANFKLKREINNGSR